MAKRDVYLRKFNLTFNKDFEYLYKNFRNKVHGVWTAKK